MATTLDKWTFSKPKPQGFSSKGRNAYVGIFRKSADGFRYVEHVMFFAERPARAMATIAASDAPAKFSMAHFDADGSRIQLAMKINERTNVAAKHTPGPWNGRDRDCGKGGTGIDIAGGPKGYVIATICYTGYPEAATADSRLIAAAPDLLMALSDLVECIAADQLLPESVSYMKATRAAIAKAEGQ